MLRCLQRIYGQIWTGPSVPDVAGMSVGLGILNFQRSVVSPSWRIISDRTALKAECARLPTCPKPLPERLPALKNGALRPSQARRLILAAPLLNSPTSSLCRLRRRQSLSCNRLPQHPAQLGTMPQERTSVRLPSAARRSAMRQRFF